MLFLNKIDLASAGVRETLAMLQPASRTPLLLRQLPVWQHGVATGFVDLALERAFLYREHAPSTVIETPAGVAPDHKEARYSMLERLADYDDALMEQLISEIEPPRDRVFDDLAKELRRRPYRAAADGLGRSRPRRHPASEGAAARGARHRANARAARHRVRRVRRSPRSCAPSTPAMAANCRSPACCAAPSPTGQASSARAAAEERIAGLSRLMGAASAKIARAEEGETVAFARLEQIATGDRFTDAKKPPEAAVAAPPPRADPIDRRACEGPQGRSPPRRGAWPSYARKIRRWSIFTTRNRASSSCSARARCIFA